MKSLSDIVISMHRFPLLIIIFIALFTTSCVGKVSISPADTTIGTEPATPDIPPLLPTIILPSFASANIYNSGIASDELNHSKVYQLGLSYEDRPILIWRFGEGGHLISLVGGIHGQYEANTVALSYELIDYFSLNSEAIYEGCTIDIIPVANPDGYSIADRLEGRFNGRGVDLNRNWGCDWSEEAFFHNRLVDPGDSPFSEPETRLLADYALRQLPEIMIFYHSAADGIFLGACGEKAVPRQWGEILSVATGYPQGVFNSYPVTGDATNWLAQNDIPGVVIELETPTESEFERNLRGVFALQCYFAEQDLTTNPDSSGAEVFILEYCDQ